MLVTSEPRIDFRIAPERFAAYVEEFRQFSATHRLPFGAPAHLFTLLTALETSLLFRAECTSMLRAVFYREHGSASPDELLMLIIVAWGGEPSSDPTPELQSTITSLLRFSIGVLRAPTAPPELPHELPEPGNSETQSEQLADPELPAAAAPADPPSAASFVEPERPPTRLIFAPRTTAPAAPTPPSPQLLAIDSELKILAIRSPDVKRYLYLLRQREQQLLPGPSPAPEPIAVALPAPEPAPPTIAPRENPWAPDSDFQIELRRFAAEREARIAAHEARQRQPPRKLGDVAEAAWHRLAGHKRHT